jgi:F0F1-type ATP synthase alpha subunit
LGDIARYEQAIYTKLDTTYSELSTSIMQTKKLTDDVEAQIKVLVKEVGEEF